MRKAPQIKRTFRRISLGFVVATITIFTFTGSASAVSDFNDFNTAGDLTGRLTGDGSAEFTRQATGGIDNTGSVNVPVPSNDVWTTKQSYSVPGAGAVYTFSAYFKVAQNAGYGNLGFTDQPVNAGDGFGQPPTGIGTNFHGGGGAFVNDGVQTLLSWPPDLVLGNWYFFIFEVTAQPSNAFDLKLQIWNTDATGALGSMKTEKTETGIINTTLGSATNIYAFFSAAGSRMDTIDNFSIDLQGASFVEEGTPVVIPGVVGTVDDTTATYGGNATADQGTTITARGSCWSTSPNPTLADTCSNDGSGTGAYLSTLTDLSPGTTYYVRSYATNANGTTYSTQETITTLGASDNETTETTQPTDVTDPAQSATGSLPATGIPNLGIVAFSLTLIAAGLVISNRTRNRTLKELFRIS